MSSRQGSRRPIPSLRSNISKMKMNQSPNPQHRKEIRSNLPQTDVPPRHKEGFLPLTSRDCALRRQLYRFPKYRIDVPAVPAQSDAKEPLLPYTRGKSPEERDSGSQSSSNTQRASVESLTQGVLPPLSRLLHPADYPDWAVLLEDEFYGPMREDKIKFEKYYRSGVVHAVPGLAAPQVFASGSIQISRPDSGSIMW